MNQIKQRKTKSHRGGLTSPGAIQNSGAAVFRNFSTMPFPDAALPSEGGNAC
jgi:hypothetical protein